MFTCINMQHTEATDLFQVDMYSSLSLAAINIELDPHVCLIVHYVLLMPADHVNTYTSRSLLCAGQPNIERV